jgi:hypothetical protein
VPTPTKLTTPLVTVQTLVVELKTDFVPSPVVETTGVKEPLKVPEPGRLVMLGVDEAALETVKLWLKPSAEE